MYQMAVQPRGDERQRRDWDMEKKQKGIVSRVRSLFSGKKLDPKEVALKLKKEVANIDESLYGLQYDLKKMSKERQRVIQKGTKAANEADSVTVQEMGQELRSLNAQIGQVQQTRNTLSKSKLLCKMTLRRVENTVAGGTLQVAGRVMQILKDEELSNLLLDGECSEEVFQAALDRKLQTLMDGIEGGVERIEMETTEEARLFAQLAEAERAGDDKKVKEIMSRMTGESKVPADFDNDSLLS